MPRSLGESTRPKVLFHIDLQLSRVIVNFKS